MEGQIVTPAVTTPKAPSDSTYKEEVVGADNESIPNRSETPTPTPKTDGDITTTEIPVVSGRPTVATATEIPEPTATETPTPGPTATETPEPTATESPTPDPNKWQMSVTKYWEMKKSDLRKKAGISSSSLAKLTKDENVTTEVLAKICNELKCDIADIMEFIPDENEGDSIRNVQ